jgi:hypothetical protein
MTKLKAKCRSEGQELAVGCVSIRDTDSIRSRDPVRRHSSSNVVKTHFAAVQIKSTYFDVNSCFILCLVMLVATDISISIRIPENWEPMSVATSFQTLTASHRVEDCGRIERGRSSLKILHIPLHVALDPIFAGALDQSET